MRNKEILKKKIVYRSTHRGSKELDLILGNFVKKYIDKFNDSELDELEKLLIIDDEVIYKWYLGKELSSIVPNNKISKLLKKFKL